MLELRKERDWRFSLGRLMMATTIVALGLGGLAFAARVEWSIEWIGLFFGMWYGSAAILGAGLLMPFNKKAIGAISGFVLALPLLQLMQHIHQP